MEHETVFIRCYRSLIASYRLTPERSEEQLSAILRRVRAALDGRGAPETAGRQQPH